MFVVLGMHHTCTRSAVATSVGSVEPLRGFVSCRVPLFHPYAVPPPATPSTGGTRTSWRFSGKSIRVQKAY